MAVMNSSIHEDTDQGSRSQKEQVESLETVAHRSLRLWSMFAKYMVPHNRNGGNLEKFIPSRVEVRLRQGRLSEIDVDVLQHDEPWMLQKAVLHQKTSSTACLAGNMKADAVGSVG
jgi:hypothetical protein